MRRSIYSAANSDLNGIATANAGADQSEESIGDFVSLDGTGSSTTGGTVDVYLWEIISGVGIVIDTPNASTSTLSGTDIFGDTVIQLTITDTNGNTDTDTVTLSIVEPAPLVISSSVPSVSGTGTLDFADGQPSEVISLRFTLLFGNSPDAMTFSGGIMVGSLSYIKTMTTGSITLDGSGAGTSNYAATGSNFRVYVTVTGRSSSYPIPATDNTLIPIY